jgi:hypothetical protein
MDPALWPAGDFRVLVDAFNVTGFRPGHAWYLNDTANRVYAESAPAAGRLRQPVLFINGEWETFVTSPADVWAIRCEARAWICP